MDPIRQRLILDLLGVAAKQLPKTIPMAEPFVALSEGSVEIAKAFSTYKTSRRTAAEKLSTVQSTYEPIVQKREIEKLNLGPLLSVLPFTSVTVDRKAIRELLNFGPIRFSRIGFISPHAEEVDLAAILDENNLIQVGDILAKPAGAEVRLSSSNGSEFGESNYTANTDHVLNANGNTAFVKVSGRISPLQISFGNLSTRDISALSGIKVRGLSGARFLVVRGLELTDPAPVAFTWIE
jgi:hypothetical protein